MICFYKFPFYICILVQYTNRFSIYYLSLYNFFQLPIFSEITKYQAHVCSPKRMAEFTNRCFNYAMLERGPVQLNIPRDMFYGDVQTKIPGSIQHTYYTLFIKYKRFVLNVMFYRNASKFANLRYKNTNCSFFFFFVNHFLQLYIFNIDQSGAFIRWKFEK